MLIASDGTELAARRACCPASAGCCLHEGVGPLARISAEPGQAEVPPAGWPPPFGANAGFASHILQRVGAQFSVAIAGAALVRGCRRSLDSERSQPPRVSRGVAPLGRAPARAVSSAAEGSGARAGSIWTSPAEGNSASALLLGGASSPAAGDRLRSPRSAAGRPRLSMPAYAGLRPIEDRGCAWATCRTGCSTCSRRNQETERHRPDRAPGPCRVAHGMRPSTGRRAGHPAPVRRPMDARALANWRRRVWRPAAIEGASQATCVPTVFAARSSRSAVGGPQPDLRRRAGRALDRHARPAPRGDAAGARNGTSYPRRRGNPAGPRGSLRDALRTHPANPR
jgi:hypothetical protein